MPVFSQLAALAKPDVLEYQPALFTLPLDPFKKIADLSHKTLLVAEGPERSREPAKIIVLAEVAVYDPFPLPRCADLVGGLLSGGRQRTVHRSTAVLLADLADGIVNLDLDRVRTDDGSLICKHSLTFYYIPPPGGRPFK